MSDTLEPTPFTQWLNGKFIEWIASTGKRHTVKEFATWLNIPRPLLSRYLNGSRIPSRKTADLIANRLGQEIYDVLGMQRPDEILQRLQGVWDRLTEEQKSRIVTIINECEVSKP